MHCMKMNPECNTGMDQVLEVLKNQSHCLFICWKDLRIWYCDELGVFPDGKGVQVGDDVLHPGLSGICWGKGRVLEEDLVMGVVFVVAGTALQAVLPGGIHVKREMGGAGC